MAKVNWLPIPGWEDHYLVSDDGRVRSLSRDITVRNPHGKLALRRFKGRALKLFITGKGYPSVKLSRPGVKPTTYYVHEAVMTAFVGPRPIAKEVCHWNGVPSDNRLANLRYDTRKANAQDRVRHSQERKK